MTGRGFKVRQLGEFAIRCSDIKKMEEFYRDIIGLEVLSGDYPNGIVFFKICDGHAGHTAVLALFQASELLQFAEQSSLHHLAFSLPSKEQDAVITWYEKNDIKYKVIDFYWIGWRGVFTKDPEENTVELVAFDQSLKIE